MTIVSVPVRGSQSASRAASVLFLLADEGRPLSLTQVAQQLGLAKSSTLSVLVSLEAARLVRREGNEYALGLGTVELGGAFLQNHDVASEFRRAAPEMPRLSREVLQLAALNGTRVIYLGRHTGRSPMAFTASVGDQFPASITAVGNALLAGLSDAEIRATYAVDPDPFPQWTGASTRSIDELIAKVQRARERGYATDDGETHPDVFGIAVLVRRPSRFTHDIAVGASLRPRRSLTAADHEALTTELLELRDRLESASRMA